MYILCDKGYIGLQNDLKVIWTKKKPINDWLSNSDKSRNQYILHVRVLLETIFGRLCSFGLFSQKWR